MTFTINEIKEIRDGLRQLEKKENDDARKINDDKRAVLEAWWNTIKPSGWTEDKEAIGSNRDEVLTAYRFIEGLLNTETDTYRLSFLRQKLQLANEKFKERKRNG